MKNAAFLPRDKAGKELWLKNFTAKIPKYATKYNILAVEISDIQQSSVYVTFINDYQNQFTGFLKELGEYVKEVYDGNKNNNAPSIAPVPPNFATIPTAVIPAVFDRAVSLANRIREHFKYTVADGNDLGIESPPKAKKVIDVNNAKPILQLQLVDGGRPEIIWKRNGLDALEIHVDRSDGNGFVLCGIDLKPNFTDEYTLPVKPELWRYKAIYRMDNKPVGKWSDVVSLAVVKLG